MVPHQHVQKVELWSQRLALASPSLLVSGLHAQPQSDQLPGYHGDAALVSRGRTACEPDECHKAG